MTTVEVTSQQRIEELQRKVEDLTYINDCLKNEVCWYDDLIMNTTIKEGRKRIIVATTPRPMRWGEVDEGPEKKIHYPSLAKTVHLEKKQLSKELRAMAKEGLYKYRKRKVTQKDIDEAIQNNKAVPTLGHDHVYIKPTAALASSADITLGRKKQGGSVWKNGRRVCKHCGSDNLERRIEVFCKDCGCSQGEKIRRDVNPPLEPHEGGCQVDTDLEAAWEANSLEEDETEQAGEAPPAWSNSSFDEETHQFPGEGGGCQLDTHPQSAPEADSSNSSPEEETESQRHNDTDLQPPLDEKGSNVPSIRIHRGGITELLNTPPAFLRNLRQWVVWRYEMVDGKLKKVPYQAKGKVLKADTTNPAHWASHEQANALYRESHEQRWSKPLDGVGIILANGLVGVDIDKCIVDGKLSDLAADVMNTVFSYSELSPSDTGIHILALGTWPGEWKRRDSLGLEVYSEGRYFTFTGQHIAGTPGDIEERTTPLAAVHAKYAPPEAIARPTETTCGHTSSTLALVSTDEILLRARNAANGAKFTRLYDEGDIDGYTSQSNADLALCNLLAHWTNDADVIDALFRKSALYREEKWDRAARIGETYGEGTIRVALEARNAA